jgi:hypothetical protein
MSGRTLEPRCLGAVTPLGQVLRHRHAADEFPACLVVGLLQRQRLVENEATRAGKAAHLSLLFAIWHECVLVGLKPLHALMIYWSISDDALAFLIFATKYRRARLADLEAELVEFDEKHDHVHLLVNYPQKVPRLRAGEQSHGRVQSNDSSAPLNGRKGLLLRPRYPSQL